MRDQAARIAALFFVFWVLFAAVAAEAETANSVDQRVVLPSDVTPDHYEIAIKPDKAALTFTGHVRIDLTVHEATDRIVLNDADIVIDHASLSGERAAPTISYDPKLETATFVFDRPLSPGEYSLSLDYHGKIYLQASGFFALDYQEAGKTKRALFTQFENADARRFTPCWDEPGRKATFTLTVTEPAGEMAVSNMPIAARTIVGGLERVRFAQTPKMSSYLLFFALGDFERIHRNVGGVDVGVIVKRGDTEDARFALDAAARILPYYNQYFGAPYPLPKLDLIAGPGSSQSYSAMENWGAIFGFERDLLVDPNVSTEHDRQEVFVTIAHEMAHQWFGDLVTMNWWDDLWLNEGFASWMESKVTDHFHPEWKIWLQASGYQDDAMSVDAREGTHPIITPIDDVLQADNAFDSITYEKGAAVIRMLEAYVGEDAFRHGVRRYIAEHAYGNTVTEDLWRAIDPVSPNRPITQIARELTLQPGVPLIRELDAACKDGRTTLTLGQDRFVDGDAAAKSSVWHIPVRAAVVGGDMAQGIVASPDDGRISLTGCGPIILNTGQTGYFRSLYSAEGIAALTNRFSDLSSTDQMGLLNDSRALGYAGYQPIATFLRLPKRAGAETDPIIWRRLTDDLADLDQLYDGLPDQARFRAYARKVLQPALNNLGWDRKPGEGDNVGIMRTSILIDLGQFGDPAVVAEAQRRFADFLRDPYSLSAAARQVVLTIVAHHADANDWDALHNLARTARTEVERQDYYELLGRADNPALATRALALSLSGEPKPTTGADIIAAASRRHPALVLDFVSANWSQVSSLLEPNERAAFTPQLAANGSDPALVDKLNAFAERNIPAADREDFVQTAARIRHRAATRATRLPDVDQWLAHPD